jgi:hypothetical protein
MKRVLSGAIVLLVGVAAAAACTGTTGGNTVDFSAAAAGPADATGGAFSFTTDNGWAVTLTKATLHLGAVYLDQSVPTSGAGPTLCILPGTYVGEVTSGLDVDLLSPTPQPFPGAGHGTIGPAAAAQMWLTGGDINAIDDPTPVLILEGTATLAGDVRPFSANITIGENRTTASATPGGDPPCRHRIAFIDLHLKPLQVASPGGLLVRIDPRRLFPAIDFSELSATTMPAASDGGGATTVYTFQDNSDDAPSANLYTNLHTETLYSLAWVP